MRGTYIVEIFDAPENLAQLLCTNQIEKEEPNLRFKECVSTRGTFVFSIYNYNLYKMINLE